MSDIETKKEEFIKKISEIKQIIIDIENIEKKTQKIPKLQYYSYLSEFNKYAEQYLNELRIRLCELRNE